MLEEMVLKILYKSKDVSSPTWLKTGICNSYC